MIILLADRYPKTSSRCSEFLSSRLVWFGSICGGSSVGLQKPPDSSSFFYAFLMLVCIALTNISDGEADHDNEIRPLLFSFCNHFPDHMQTLAWLLYAPVSFKVSLCRADSGFMSVFVLSLIRLVWPFFFSFNYQSAALLNNVYKSVKNFKHFLNSVLRYDVGGRRSANGTVCRWLQIMCKMSLLGFVSCAMQFEMKDIHQLLKKEPKDKNMKGLAHVLEVVWGMRPDDILKGNLDFPQDFSAYIIGFQRRFHVPLILKYMERALLPGTDEKDMTKWYFGVNKKPKPRGGTKKKKPEATEKKPPPNGEATGGADSGIRGPSYLEALDGIDIHDVILKPMVAVSLVAFFYSGGRSSNKYFVCSRLFNFANPEKRSILICCGPLQWVTCGLPSCRRT